MLNTQTNTALLSEPLCLFSIYGARGHVWTPDFFFSALTEWTASGPWGWQKECIGLESLTAPLSYNFIYMLNNIVWQTGAWNTGLVVEWRKSGVAKVLYIKAAAVKDLWDSVYALMRRTPIIQFCFIGAVQILVASHIPSVWVVLSAWRDRGHRDIIKTIAWHNIILAIKLSEQKLMPANQTVT